jgi:hypothetical protein
VNWKRHCGLRDILIADRSEDGIRKAGS